MKKFVWGAIPFGKGFKMKRFIGRAAAIGAATFTFNCADTKEAPQVEALDGHSETEQTLAPVGAGFTINAGDLRFIFRQIQIAQAHAGGGQLFGPGPNQVNDPRLPFGLRTVDGSFNHLLPDQTRWGAADEVFPRLSPAFDRPNYPPQGNVTDSQPRVITNLISDQTVNNPAAVAVTQAAGGECLDLPDTRRDPTCFMGNVAPDVGLSAPFNSMFTFFGQFFDHGLDLVTKGNETVLVPLQPDDPLYVPGSPTNFMVLNRATNHPGPDNIFGTADDIHDAINTTTPFVDQNQTYTSHPSHQVFLREYDNDLTNPPRPTGRILDGAGGNIGNWGEVKAQARTKLGIALSDSDVFDVPLILTDPYGHFKPGPRGFPQIVQQNGALLEGDPNAPITTANALRTGHAFLDDIAHRAVPRPGLSPDSDLVVTTGPQDPGTYDDELLAAHFCTGDGRGNENIALTAVHTVFHSEHNRLAAEIGGANGVNGGLIDTLLTPAEAAAWRAIDPASGWGYEERIFQAARFVTEMQYQHLVFEEFARKLVPSIDPFIGDGINMSSRFNPAISAEFAHAVYRLGHSMLTDTIARERPDGTTYDIPLLDGFLNPLEFNHDGLGGTLTAAQAAGAIFQGGTRQRGNQIDEFVTEAVRNNLLGLPLDLGVLNLARGRSESLPPLNILRAQLFQATSNFSLAPYNSWSDFGFALRNRESLVNFIAAYGVHPTLAAVPNCTTGPAPDCGVAGRRAAAQALLVVPEFMEGPAAFTGVNDIDLWIGGLAERPAPFGSMLGPTFSYVFEQQMERLQNEDRFYYLERLDGLNLLSQMEGNSFQELIQRNTEAAGLGQDAFGRPDLVLNLARIAGPGNTIVDDPGTPFNEPELVASGHLTRLSDGTFRYSGPLHVIWNGSDTAADRIISSEGDDSIVGNGGDDFIEGGAGNDQIKGGAGDDILVDIFGDDVIKGGPGDDVIGGGPGIDLLQGNEGNDFIVAGPDSTEVFGGPGNDFFYMGAGLSESIGGAGDDWFEGTTSPASIGIGDDNNQFQDDPNGGHDVGVAGPGDMDFDMEGGDDIMVSNVVPTHRCEGMLGFDWVTYRGETVPVDADMLVTGAIAVNAPLNELRDRFDNVEGLSGTNFNDVLRGDNRLEADLRNDGLTGVDNGHVLTAAGIGRINGVAALLPAGATEFAGGNIILGGGGSDTIEGRGGDDIIDGDHWLNVRISVRDANDNEIGSADRMNGVLTNKAGLLAATAPSLTLQQAMFSGLLKPGQLRIVREILPGNVAGDVDTAVFSDVISSYDFTPGADGWLIVNHARGTATDGIDRVRNVERLQFLDITIDASAIQGNTDTTPPAAVAGFTPTAGNAQVTLAFTPPFDAVAVRILRSTTGFAGSPIPVAGQTVVFDALATGFTDVTVTNGTTYFYTAFARDAAGNYSTAATTTATPIAPTPPTPQPPPPPGPMTTLFSDNFDSCTSTTNLGSRWQINGRWYCASGKARGEVASGIAMANQVPSANVEVQARVQLTGSSGNASGVIARANGNSYYAARIMREGRVELIRVNNGSVTILGSAPATIQTEPTLHRIMLRATGTTTVRLEVYLSDTRLIDFLDSSANKLTSGGAGLLSGTATRTQYDDFFLRTDGGTTTNPPPPTDPPPTNPPAGLVFSDNFDACNSTVDLGSQWTTSGRWYCAGDKGRGEIANSVALANTVTLVDTSIRARIQLAGSATASGVAARVSGNSYYAARLLRTGSVQLIRVNNGTVTVLGTVPATINAEPSSYRVTLEVTGTTIVNLNVRLGDNVVLTATDSTANRLLTGRAGLLSGTSSRTQYDDVVINAL